MTVQCNQTGALNFGANYVNLSPIISIYYLTVKHSCSKAALGYLCNPMKASGAAGVQGQNFAAYAR